MHNGAGSMPSLMPSELADMPPPTELRSERVQVWAEPGFRRLHLSATTQSCHAMQRLPILVYRGAAMQYQDEGERRMA
jgi:hypothetical protein